MILSTHPAATNPAMIPQCHAENQWRRGADRNRSAKTITP